MRFAVSHAGNSPCCLHASRFQGAHHQASPVASLRTPTRQSTPLKAGSNVFGVLQIAQQPAGGHRQRQLGACVRMSAVATADSSVSGRMAELKKQGKVAFIPFLTAGDPDLGTTAEALVALCEEGADVLELGMPYSDPLADGPTIHAASTRSLNGGTTVDKVLAMLKEVSPRLTAPVVVFTYYNPIMRKGLDTFCQQIKDAGAAGLLVPDIPLEETDDIRATAEVHGLELVLLTTPTTPKARMDAIAQKSQGFVYLVSVTGVTGAKEQVSVRVEGLVEDLHAVTDKPVCVGFGVSNAEHVRSIVGWGAEGVIVGSALVRALGEGASPEDGLKRLRALARELKSALP